MTPTVVEILKEHVRIELKGIDRLYLNGYVPGLQTPAAVAYFRSKHRGAKFASYVRPERARHAQGAVMTPWTHLVILSTGLLFGTRSRCGRRRRPAGRRYSRRAGIVTAAARQWNAMAHGDRVFFHEDFFDQQADDFLFFGDTEVFGRLLQPPQKALQRLIKLPELRLGQRLPLCALQLLLRGGLFFPQRGHPLAQLGQSEQAFLIRVEELVDFCLSGCFSRPQWLVVWPGNVCCTADFLVVGWMVSGSQAKKRLKRGHG